MPRVRNCTCCLLRIGGVDVLLRGSRGKIFDRSDGLGGLVDGLLLPRNDDGMREMFLLLMEYELEYTPCRSECGDGFHLYFF